MFDWLRRRRLSNEAKRKLLIVAARSEEALVETHVSNVLELLEVLSDEVDVDRALALYAEMIPMDEHVSTTVTNRVLARHDSPVSRGRGAPSGSSSGSGSGASGGDGGRYSRVFRDSR